MKTVTITERLPARDLLPESDEEDVVVMRNGHPIALVTPFYDDDLEWYAREHDPKFVESIRRAREQVARGETISEDELDTVLGNVVDGIDVSEFSAPLSVGTLQRTNCSAVPSAPGVYVVLYPKRCKPEFLDRSVGGWFKGLDPTDPPDFLNAHWVEGATVIYVGKGNGRGGLKQRLRQLVQFGNGRPVGHRGGRLLWNLRNHKQLFVRWLVASNPTPAVGEAQLIEQFHQAKGARPFANLIG